MIFKTNTFECDEIDSQSIVVGDKVIGANSDGFIIAGEVCDIQQLWGYSLDFVFVTQHGTRLKVNGDQIEQWYIIAQPDRLVS